MSASDKCMTTCNNLFKASFAADSAAVASSSIGLIAVLVLIAVHIFQKKGFGTDFCMLMSVLIPMAILIACPSVQIAKKVQEQRVTLDENLMYGGKNAEGLEAGDSESQVYLRFSLLQILTAVALAAVFGPMFYFSESQDVQSWVLFGFVVASTGINFSCGSLSLFFSQIV